MTIKAFTALALAGLLVSVGCSESGPTAQNAAATTPEATGIRLVEANISGMDCNGCTSHVCAMVDQITGVSGSSADLATGNFTAGIQEGVDTAAAIAEIEKVIAGLGNGKYTVNAIQAVTPGDVPPTQAQPPSPDQAPREDA